ncbi:flavohemoglobin expression-modulating QEGLA motif protein [Photobacterium sp. ZSDE20]|uniref:Flavohemoglobin expression-modulating QEGLA motif protein n=1 Tax=Photobacterium pectinilyticum TaxID=2906793 RepID=A0ABT1N7G2_9GAMM|nr:flavohemoglobin expression-modulating QEGLA motif protein [Photobacterium sp. ZSDE20]MCQ1059759.1 flavohemoglobin expression-modulating QEGLA motif protein [Photobacterium sp. ZSDE20]MDD1825994.1 flavohemoglobin expression-modulating QEGLA motif protein [Photobacterium sp. ZSDE20]
MLQLSEAEILERIQQFIPFEAQLNDGSLTIRISEYQPYIATALHHGHNLRGDLMPNCLLTEEERYFEEDPFTGDFISSLPIVLQGEDSRYEYDLNRAPENCIYDEAWGKPVWQTALTDEERAVSLAKHDGYYRILACLIDTLESQFGLCLLYDVHSYNYQRIDRNVPVFNLGTKQVNTRRWRKEIDSLVDKLRNIELPNVEVTAEVNDVFQGMGYQASFVKSNFTNTLIMPLEVKKVFMDEARGESFPLVIDKLRAEMKNVLTEHAAETILRRTKVKKLTGSHVLASKLPREVLKLDRQLFSIARGVNTLGYITPLNIKQEKRRFLHRPYDYQLNFTYRQLDLDPFKFREQLYRLPVEDIRDADIQAMYRKVIDQLAVRIDLLTSIGSDEFLYNSLRYYGQPDQNDIANANFFLHAGEYSEPEEETISAQEAIQAFKQAADEYGLKCKVAGSKQLIARAMVSGRTIKVNQTAKFNRKDLDALIHHELGVHLVTSANADIQPLKVLKLGLPGNTHTQEGLAILCEHLSGSFPLHRLKTLALRVVAVDMMVKGESFNETFHVLKHDYGISNDQAFTITARAYRGGGFTKDYLYLKGLKDALHAYANDNLTSLFIGKTGFEFKPLLDELITREILKKPTYMPKALAMKDTSDPIINYMLKCIK